ncbi:MAG: molybdenum cofactor guanylyltransferase [Gammaproteobacteria bacterium]|nr:molybdenum cofactor guanylyltransferase [Gammaproteobacteria bacterium]
MQPAKAMSDIPKTAITALILAGGRGTRMGGRDKGLLAWDGVPLIERVLAGVTPLVGGVLISANRDLDRYRTYGFPVLPDAGEAFSGPLAGIARGLDACTTPWLWVLPCDVPQVHGALLARLIDACVATGCSAAVAHDAQHLHATFALLNTAVAPALHAFRAAGRRRAQDWLATLPAAQIDCSDHPEWFVNLNTPEDLLRHRRPGAAAT